MINIIIYLFYCISIFSSENSEHTHKKNIVQKVGLTINEIDENDLFYHRPISDYVQAYTDAIEKNPLNANYFIKRAGHYENMSEWQKAANDYEAAIKIKGNDHHLCLNCGEMYEKLNNLEKAIQFYTKAIEISEKGWFFPDIIPEYYGYRARVYAKQKKYMEALCDYNTAINTESIRLEYQRGNVYFELKDYKKARLDYEKAILFFQKNRNRVILNYDKDRLEYEIALEYSKIDKPEKEKKSEGYWKRQTELIEIKKKLAEEYSKKEIKDIKTKLDLDEMKENSTETVQKQPTLLEKILFLLGGGTLGLGISLKYLLKNQLKNHFHAANKVSKYLLTTGLATFTSALGLKLFRNYYKKEEIVQ